MTREEALLHFKNKYVKEALKINSQEFNKNLKKHKLWLKETLIKAMEEICSIIRKKQVDNEYKIMYFNFSLLRTSIINQEYTILLSAYNENWYLDDYATHITINISPIVKVLDNLKNYLEEKRKLYVGKVQSFDINEVLLEQSFKYYTSLEKFVIKIFKNIEEKEWFEAVNKIQEYYIRWGEYRDSTHIVYKMDESEKSKEDFIKALDELEDENKKDKLIFSTWKNIELEKLSCIGKNLMFSNFKNSNLKHLIMTGNVLLGANFKNANFKECDFSHSLLENASFENAKLEDVSFQDAILKGANFVYADFKNVYFENSNLKEAHFLKKDIPFIHLSPSQLQTIVIEEE